MKTHTKCPVIFLIVPLSFVMSDTKFRNYDSFIYSQLAVISEMVQFQNVGSSVKCPIILENVLVLCVERIMLGILEIVPLAFVRSDGAKCPIVPV